MPRPGPPRPTITIRLHQSGIDRLDNLAKEQSTTRSELVRRAINLLPASTGATSPPTGKNDQEGTS